MQMPEIMLHHFFMTGILQKHENYHKCTKNMWKNYMKCT